MEAVRLFFFAETHFYTRRFVFVQIAKCVKILTLGELCKYISEKLKMASRGKHWYNRLRGKKKGQTEETLKDTFMAIRPSSGKEGAGS